MRADPQEMMSAESRNDRKPHRLLQRMAAGKSSGAVAEGMEVNPLRDRARHAFFRAGSWSINGDTCSGRCSLDLLYGSSDADLIERGRPEFDGEVTCVGFSV